MKPSLMFKTTKGLTKSTIRQISAHKKESEWMLDQRLAAYTIFKQKPMPLWGGDLSPISFDRITYYLKATTTKGRTWKEVPTKIRDTFDRLGIPESEKRWLAGVGAQYESESVYHELKQEWRDLGIIFEDTDTALKKYPDIFRKYFGTVVPAHDNKFAALNTAVWSGGTFIYVPKGVQMTIPLQNYFRINAKGMGQFERTLIIADEGSSVSYVEGCFTAGARVQTNTGDKLIETIHIGDAVMTHKGRMRTVSRVIKRAYSGKIYQIKYYGDSSHQLNVTEEHPLLVVKREQPRNRNRSFLPVWVTAKEVKTGDYLAIPIPSTTEIKNNKQFITVSVRFGQNTSKKSVIFKIEKDFFRLLGYFHAEGHVEREHYLTFSFATKETAYIADVRELLFRYFGKLAGINKPRQGGQSLVLSSTEVARAFAAEFGSTINNKRVPDYIKNAPLDILAEWVKGIWCGDGSYDTKKNMFRFNTISLGLAHAFRDALLRLGIAASINKQTRLLPRHDIYAVVVSSPWNTKFGQIVGQPAVNGSRSGSPFQLDHNYLYVPIRSINTKVRTTTVYNLSVEEDESYVCEGVISHNCTAPVYSTDSLHAAVVEIIALKNARVRYTTIQNWSNNIYNLVTKRAVAHAGATVEWIDGNLGSKLTMKYPSVYLIGKNASADILSLAIAAKGQHQDAGAKVVHLASDTSSVITSKSISGNGGRTSYRGLVEVSSRAQRVRSRVKCDALLLDDQSRSDTYPTISVKNQTASVEHEAAVGKISEEQLFYAQSRGLDAETANTLIVNGFIEPIVKELPMEYAVELNRLISMQMEGSVG